MADIVVTGNQLTFGGKSYRCAVGKSGAGKNKSEGDGATPIGIFRLRECWYRADRLSAPKTGLPLKMIHEYDGWCDDPKSGDYNRHVLISSSGREGSHERLWRDDHSYDIIVPMGYNDDPIVPGKGSAIFLHVAKPDYAPTEGCVALSKDDLLEMLLEASTQTCIEIR